MSRSRKRNPIIRIGFKPAKRYARRRVRYYRGTIPNGSFYKKLYPQYDITDYWFINLNLKHDIREFKRLYKELQLNFYNKDIDEILEELDRLKDLHESFKYLYK